MTGGSTLTTYYFAGGAYEVQDNGTTQKIIKYYAFGGMIVAMNDGSGLKYFLTDHLGSVTAVLDAAGALLQQQRYYPFGEVRDLPNDNKPKISATDFGYTGQRALDAQGNSFSLGLMDYKARFYDTYITHFSQPDTIIPDQYNPQTLNRYAYALNNPIRYNDPTGHRNCEEDGYNCAGSGSSSSSSSSSDDNGSSDKTSDTGDSCSDALIREFNPKCNQNTTAGNTNGSLLPINPTIVSPNSPLIPIIIIGLLIHGVTIVTEVGVVLGELTLAGGTIVAPELTVPLEIVLGAVGVAVLDFDVAYLSYVYRVYANPDIYQKVELFPPWGF